MSGPPAPPQKDGWKQETLAVSAEIDFFRRVDCF